MKMPNEPESTTGLGAGLLLSFLSAAYAYAAKDAARITARARRVGVSNFTRRLLVPCVRRFASSPALPRFRPRSPRLVCLRCRPAWRLSYKSLLALRTFDETAVRLPGAVAWHPNPPGSASRVL